MRTGLIGVALVLAQAAGAPPLQPADKWLVEYNEGDCTMSRPFGDPAAPTTFALQPSPTGGLGEVILLLPANGRKGVRRGKGVVTLLPSGKRFEAQYAVGPLPDGKRRGARFAAEQEFWEELPNANALTVNLDETPFTMALGGMARPLQAAKQCSDDLLKRWGASPDAIARWREGTSPLSLFSPSTYPFAAIRDRVQGRTVALVGVDREGRPTECRTVQTDTQPVLDTATCNLLMRGGRFEDVGGDGPEKRWAVVPVRWALPR